MADLKPNFFIQHNTPMQQRLGFLVGLLLHTYPNKKTSSKSLAKSFFGILQKKQLAWLRPTNVKQEEEDKRRLAEIGISPDWSIPAIRKITDEGGGEIIEKDLIDWAGPTGMGLLDSYNMWNPIQGRILGKFIEDYQRKCFLGEAFLPNPLLLSPRQKVYFLWLLFYADGLFYLPFVKLLKDQVSAWQDGMPAYKQTLEQLSAVLSSSKKTRFQKLGQDVRKLLTSERKLKEMSMYARVLSKLEALVDLSLLQKPEPRAYIYNVPEALYKLQSKLPDLAEVKDGYDESFLWTKFFGVVNDVLGQELPRQRRNEFPERNEYLDQLIGQNYNNALSGVGVARIFNIAVSSCINFVCTVDDLPVEVEEVRERLEELHQKYGKMVTLHVDIYGKTAFVRIDKQVLKNLTKNPNETL